MTSITLHSLPSRPALPLTTGSVARAMAVAMNTLTAPWRRLNQSTDVEALRELAHTHVVTSPSYAADLLAAAERHESVVEQA